MCAVLGFDDLKIAFFIFDYVAVNTAVAILAGRKQTFLLLFLYFNKSMVRESGTTTAMSVISACFFIIYTVLFPLPI